jgi:hypothetical protein
MARRPWRLLWEDADGRIRVATTFHHKPAADARRDELAAANPGIIYYVEKHVDFEATR